MCRSLKQENRTIRVLLAATLLLSGLLVLRAAETIQVPLEYREVDFSLQSLRIVSQAITNASQVFKNLPAEASTNSQCMNLIFGKTKVGTIWDPKSGVLWVDQNRNLDFTDDPNGRYLPSTNQSALSFSRGNRMPEFPKLKLTLPLSNGVYQFTIGLTMGRYFDELKSFYEGKLVIGQREWQVGCVISPQYSPQQNYLLVRPWTERSNAFTARAWSTETFPLGGNISINGKNYRVSVQQESLDGITKPRLEFTEKPAPSGELLIAGEFIDKVVLVGKDQQISLSRPFVQTTVPATTYQQMIVQLKAGATEAAGTFHTPIIIQEGKTNRLLLGGPLTNLVAITPQGRELNLGYTLMGADGRQYQLSRKNNPEAPRLKFPRVTAALLPANLNLAEGAPVRTHGEYPSAFLER